MASNPFAGEQGGGPINKMVAVAGWLDSLATIESRQIALNNGGEPNTYTSTLLADPNERVKKLGSETAELVQEQTRQPFDRQAFIGEAADLLYAIEVAVAARDISMMAVLQELARRNRAGADPVPATFDNLRRVTSADELVYKQPGPSDTDLTIPVFCVDGQAMTPGNFGAFRMQAFATKEAVEKTFETGTATFWSRKRREIWVKGDGSGNTLEVRQAFTDCDADVLLLDTKPNGPTCHTGANSCFEVPPVAE